MIRDRFTKQEVAQMREAAKLVTSHKPSPEENRQMLVQLMNIAKHDERKAIVAWIREQMSAGQIRDGYDAADMIERLEHLKEKP